MSICDYLEAEAVEDGIPLKAVSAVEKQGAWKDLFEVIDRFAVRNPKSRKAARQEEEACALCEKHSGDLKILNDSARTPKTWAQRLVSRLC